MKYDTDNPRYSHLCGLSAVEVDLVMALADAAINLAERGSERCSK